MADNVTLPMTKGGLSMSALSDVTTETPGSGYQRDLKTSIIAMSIVGGIVVMTILTIWVIWWKFCKSPRSRHGVERDESNGGGGKKQYYDQFCVNDHQLTVNSVTAFKWEEDEKRSNKSSGIDCDSHSSEPVKEERKVITGKRVFSVNKVQEKPGHPMKAANGRAVVIRLPKQYADITRSLQAGDGKNYTLAIIDKQSQTVHNIDMRNYKLRKSVSPNSAAPSGGAQSYKYHYHSHHRRNRHRSDGNSRSSGAQSAVEMLHDSPDFSAARRKRHAVANESASEMRTTRSLTDFSDSSGSAGERRSDSLSSHDEESGKGLLNQTKPTDAVAAKTETTTTTDSERETLLHDYQ